MAGNKLAEAFIEITPDFGGFKSALVDGFGLAFGSAATSIAASFDVAGKELMKKFTIPLAVATAANIAQFQALEREINTVITLFGTAPGLVDETFGAMSQGVREVAREVGGLEKDIAGGLYQAISAGVPKDSVFEFLDVAQMAAMADKAADLTVAVDGISTAVNAFSGEGLSAARASDILFAGVAAGKTTFAELGSSIGRAAGLAANAGVEFAEFIATIAQMTKSGIATSEAVSYMRAAVTSLLRPSEDMNAIFREIGFATAEAAVPVIGLQASLQTLVDATGGSTSKLQELLGSAEAVSTVLAITGEKAGAFSTTLAGIEASAGSTTRAYEIMERGVGRSFGRLTEAFDQLGNVFGEMGAAFVQPLVDTFAETVSGLGAIFEGFIPLTQALGEAVEDAMGFFDIPLIGAFTQGILAAGIAIAGLLGVVGPLIFALGQLIKLVVVNRLLSATQAVAGTLSIGLSKLQLAMNGAIVKGGLLGKALGVLNAAFSKLLIGLGTTSGAVLAAFAAIAVAAGVIYGLSKAYESHRNAQREAALQNDIFVDGIDRLLESAGIARTELPSAYEAAIDGVETLRSANFRLIAELVETKEQLGAQAAEDLLLDIGLTMVWEGGTPEDAFKVMQDLAAETFDLSVPIDLAGFTEASRGIEGGFAGAEAGAAKIRYEIDEATAAVGGMVDVTRGVSFKALTDNLRTMFTVADTAGELPLFKGELLNLEGIIGNSQIFSQILQGIVEGLKDVNGEPLNIDATGVSSVEEFFGLLTDLERVAEDFEEGIVIPIDTDIVKDEALDEFYASMKENLKNLPPQIEGVTRLTGEQGAVLHKMIQDTDAVFAAALDSITTAQAAITSGLEAQIPVFGGYTAAVEISLDAVRESALAWQGDVDLVAESTDLLKDTLSDDELTLFNQKSLSEQAGYLKGDLDDVIEKLEIFKTVAASTDVVEGIKIEEQMTTIMENAQTILNTGIDGLVTSSAEAGASVSQAFLDRFNSATNGAATWSPKAQEYMDLVEDVVGAEINGPTITAPTFIGGSTTYTVHVSASNSPSPGRDVSRALLYAGNPQ